jgi:hypothetical protein
VVRPEGRGAVPPDGGEQAVPHPAGGAEVEIAAA